MVDMHSLPPEHDIHVAKGADIDQACRILASAFTDDPVCAWFSGHPEIYASLFRYHAEALYKRYDQIYINKEKTGAAMWLPPRVSIRMPFHSSVFSVAWRLAKTGGMKSISRGIKLEEILLKHYPKTPHFYLHAVGASLNNQGRGIGSALIKTGLTKSDKQGVPVYLESSNEKNNPLYERCGFEVIGEISLPDGGPTMWRMRREAQPINL